MRTPSASSRQGTKYRLIEYTITCLSRRQSGLDSKIGSGENVFKQLQALHYKFQVVVFY